MKDASVAGRYARALAIATERRSETVRALEDLQAMLATLGPGTRVGALLASPLVLLSDKRKVLRDVLKDTILWSNPSIAIREEYDATSSVTNDPTGFVDPSSFFTQESNALERVSSEFSRSVVSAILEAF